ncbi:MAG: hypothetical protein ACKVOA_01410 [Methylophilaceae bacterium]
MSSIFGCCLWPFLLGVLLGWLANWLMCRSCCKAKPAEPMMTNTPTPPAAKMAEVPTASVAAPVAPAMKAAPVAKPKAAAKPKAVAKPKAAPKAASINLAAAKAAGFSMKNADDLTVIEGIGPKINDLFKAAGLKTFAQVSNATVPQMRDILDKGGSRFRIANPGTWAQQAELANSNKWTELKKLQDELSAGLKK